MIGQKQQLGRAAAVIGGGMAGLLAARVLADHFELVTILERDTLPASGEPRKGVPQGRHAHAILARGQQILEELFPGITQQLVEQGAVRGHGRFYSGGGYHRRICEGPGGLFVSRPCLETAVRTRLLALYNVRVVEGCEVRGLWAGEGQGRVTGVRLGNRPREVAGEILQTDLVVDAGGRGSQAPAWLDALGYPRAEVELVKVGMGYATRLYRRTPDHLHGDAFVNVAPTPANRRACGMLAQEGDRWIVTLAGYFGDYPPVDEHGFVEFARSLPVPDVYEVVRSTRPLSTPISYRFPANQRRHYEGLAHFPDGFLVFGDAICSFTPIYGQGMTVAALEALALRECLVAGTHKLAPRFFSRASGIVDIAWRITVGNDLRLSETAGACRRLMRFGDWYNDKLQIAARHDTSVALAFQKVANLVAAPSSLLRPRIALRVLRGSFQATAQAR